ncbi:putative cytochrome P450 superfamily protein [Hibiscus syriacus]|uniref:Cytochrome P450 superfamily protein n=1 Tax=Hibiscus syriacus TaxID=106335 RepID=A0A6A3B7H6_HIBSY|nr:putative cytochrome P450 superfamily protein [Hibiscus syriacus]
MHVRRIVVPTIQGYEDAGDFTVAERLKTSIHANLVFYLCVGSLGLVGVILFIIFRRNWSGGILGFAMACPNTFGLVTGDFLLGFGLIEIPKGILRLLAVILGCMSAAILIAEATILPHGVDLSLFSILISPWESRNWLGRMVARYAPPISYNFLNLIYPPDKRKTVFENVYTEIEEDGRELGIEEEGLGIVFEELGIFTYPAREEARMRSPISAVKVEDHNKMVSRATTPGKAMVESSVFSAIQQQIEYLTKLVKQTADESTPPKWWQKQDSQLRMLESKMASQQRDVEHMLQILTDQSYEGLDFQYDETVSVGSFNAIETIKNHVEDDTCPVFGKRLVQLEEVIDGENRSDDGAVSVDVKLQNRFEGDQNATTFNFFKISCSLPLSKPSWEFEPPTFFENHKASFHHQGQEGVGMMMMHKYNYQLNTSVLIEGV